ncbi:hypothetical protein COO59_14280 [Mixta theicola]|uniref:Coenzyme Q-binding protein COQ10 START domain-containing protein n=1 Tax=Mixta theicola TaxID=1458355 RepID=A0A2K1Q7T3_9GAMM|nr:SRPBCC family protein [Mixta theicola]PNS11092.1 hypothetical protein COO59_14280 [Mixta theicola]GLR08439.1 hypothetical protein GCM10007905_11580 [Mixta theicola]
MDYAQSNSIVCNATQEAVYALICNSQQWPQVFDPCISVENLGCNENEEFIRVKAMVGDEPMVWESKRVFRKEIFGIDATIIKPMMFVKNMVTTWRVVKMNHAQSLIILEHDYTLLDDIPDYSAKVTTREQAQIFIADAINRNSTRELKNIRDAVKKTFPRAGAGKRRSTSHTIVCDVPAKEVYSTIANVNNWPKIFDACTSAVVREKKGNTERVRIEAWQDDRVVGWDTQRSYFDKIYRIDFSLPVPMPFLKEMSGQWRVIPLDEHRCVLNVTREFSLLDDITAIRENITTHEEASEFINQFIDNNAGSEMLAIKEFVEKKDITLSSFTTRYSLPFAAKEVYDLLCNVHQWQDILPHCEGVKMIYEDDKYQEFIMNVMGGAGEECFRSIRQCDKDAMEITYFQPEPPAVLKNHNGRWLVRSSGNGCEIISEHSLHIESEYCSTLFSDDDILRNKQRIKELIMKNSKATVEACGYWLKKQRMAA